MRLKQLRLRNFRCFKEETAIDFDSNFTALIGRNDVGKSSILDALAILLNDESPDKNDASKQGDPKDLTIIGVFNNLPKEIVIDETHPTSLSEEFLLNEQGDLEIHKTYSGNTASPKCQSIALFAHHPTTKGADDLTLLDIKSLRVRAKETGVTDDVNKAVSAKLRKAIRNSFPKLEFSSRLIPLNDGDGKSIWETLKQYTPKISVFKSDRASSDQDAEAQDPIKIAVKEALQEKLKELQEIEKHVVNRVTSVAAMTVEKLKELDNTLAKQLTPQFSVLKWDNLFKASITGDDEIPLNKRGSGVRRLVLLGFFQAKVELEQASTESRPVIYAIEEPETSQHPHNQRLLLNALRDLSIESQVVITSHTPLLVRCVQDTCVRFIQREKDSSRSIHPGGSSINTVIAKSLGILPDNSVRLFIGVEGPNDIHFLKAMSRVLVDAKKTTLDLTQLELSGEVIFIPLGGSTLALWTNRLNSLHRPEFHLFDRDNAPPSQPQYKSFMDDINKRGSSCVAVCTDRREMENYIDFRSINLAYQKNSIAMSLSKNFSEFDDVPELVAQECHSISSSGNNWSTLDDDEKKKKASRAKKMLNEKAAYLMSYQTLVDNGVFSEIHSWFLTMERLFSEASTTLGETAAKPTGRKNSRKASSSK